MTVQQAKHTFASLMQTARKRKLSAKELTELSIARQKMRMVRRPAMNVPTRPIGKGKKTKRNGKYHYEKESITFGQAKQIAKSHGYRLVDTGDDYKITGKYFPTGYFAESLDDIIGTLKVELERHAKSNPDKPVLIYGNVRRIEAIKSQDHICDEECKACGHRYFHDFTTKPKMYGLPDGSLLIKV